MKIQINSDSSIALDSKLSEFVESSIGAALERFATQISRVEVHLSDANAGKGGSDDKRCVVEARLAGRDPVAVTGEGPDLETAAREASHKMERMLDRQIGKLEAR